MNLSNTDGFTYDLQKRFDVPVTMRDGITLSTDIYIPNGSGPFPTLLTRTPYDNSVDQYVDMAKFYTGQGYAYVIQDCRGRYDSGGVFYAWFNEANDGYDTQEWIGQQAWCNGKIGTLGASYDGFTQWASAPFRSRYLKTMIPRVMHSDTWRETHYFGGAFALTLALYWGLRNSARTRQNANVHDWDEVMQFLPLIKADRAAGRDVKYFQDWIKHSSYDDYWKEVSNHYSEIDVPILNMTGWFDVSGGGNFINFNGMINEGFSSQTRANQKLIIGPWPHELSASSKTGQLDFGPESQVNLLNLELRWLDYWLKGIENGIMDEAPIRIFIMGANSWRDEWEWPLSRTIFTDYYLHSRGNANNMVSDGVLNNKFPDQEPSDSYFYDPNNPVPTLGGNHDMPPEIISVGPWDQRPLEARDDVLVYTSDVLEDDLEITGPVVLHLYAASSASDTDFTARLIDVYPDGRSMNLCEGVIRARYRDSFTNPSLMVPETVYEFTISLEVTSNLFKRNHRIRLDISSSNFPRIDRNPNTGHEFGMKSEMMVAKQNVFHTSRFPSRIVLPVIPLQ